MKREERSRRKRADERRPAQARPARAERLLLGVVVGVQRDGAGLGPHDLPRGAQRHGLPSAQGNEPGSWACLALCAAFAAGFVFSFFPFVGYTRSLRAIRAEREEDPRR